MDRLLDIGESDDNMIEFSDMDGVHRYLRHSPMRWLYHTGAFYEELSGRTSRWPSS